MTFNVGVGVSWFAADHFIVRADARYRYVDALVDAYDDSLDTAETTIGIGWRF
jgi:hypothetical protein